MRRRMTLSLTLVAAAMLLWAVGPTMAAHSDHGCTNCHAPHNAAPETNTEYGVPLFSMHQLEDGIPTYDLYDSDTLEATMHQPQGPTKLCLGCHDGSYGRVASHGDPITASELPNQHPVSFVYDTALASADVNGGLEDPATASWMLPAEAGDGDASIADRLLTDKGGETWMHCTSCHDVHTTGHTSYMLRWNVSVAVDENNEPVGVHQSGGNNLCRVCHDK